MTTPQISIGLQPDGVLGVRVAKPGYDVLTNPIDNEQLIFNSDWESIIPLYQSGTITIADATTDTVNFTTLGAIPLILVAAKIGSDYEFIRDKDWGYDWTATVLTITNTSGGSLTFKYWITRLLLS